MAKTQLILPPSLCFCAVALQCLLTAIIHASSLPVNPVPASGSPQGNLLSMVYSIKYKDKASVEENLCLGPLLPALDADARSRGHQPFWDQEANT